MLNSDRQTTLVKERSLNYDVSKFSPNGQLSTPSIIKDMLCTVFHADRMAEEHFWLIALNAKCHPIGVFEISHGTMTQTIVSQREIFVRLCLCGATRFIVAHNHPSGDPTPSEEDFKVTEHIKAASNIMDIPFLDHIIIGEEKYYSLHEMGTV
jgi:DNA repair protein RadC